ncbi:MAG: hypothetical protein AAF851_07515 [Myxococcota bacterium]
MDLPSFASPPFDAAGSLVFCVICLVVVVSFVALHARAGLRWRPFALGLGGWLGLFLVLAGTGVLSRLAGSMALALYLVAANGAALVMALTLPGRLVVKASSAWMLIAFQLFRGPLELVLHHWYALGALPVQMTYEGQNLDILTAVAGAMALVFLRGWPPSDRYRWWVTLSFNLVGAALLLNVMRVAMQSAPWPMRTFMNDPPVVLPFFVPQTLIVPVCVAGALWGHVVTFRWLWAQRRLHGGLSRTAG